MSTVEDSRPSSATMEIAAATFAGGWLLEVQDESGARRLPLTGDRLVVGTSGGADVVVKDATVSARHCALSVRGAGVVVADLGSRNGTFVGSARVQEAWARAGTAVSVGRSTLIISAGDWPQPGAAPGGPLPGVAGASIAMRHLADQVRRLAQHTLPVLVSGESGSGKELVARAIHLEGPRRQRPFVALNVTALPRELVETELFGHERGAFTGAHARRMGAFAESEGGTLFLDEVGDLPLEAQPKLLRALDGYEIRRVGATGSGKRADVRVVAATHAPLEKRVDAGLFRRDLYHRLECFVVTVPPLRDRRGDVSPIARELLSQLASQVGPRTLTSAALGRLVGHDWPGNVRELRNVLCRAADGAARAGVLDVDDIDRALRRDRYVRPHTLTPQAAQNLLRDSGGNLSAAARSAGMPRTSFRKLLGS